MLSAARLVAGATLASALAMQLGCERVTHDMADQPRANPAQASRVFSDGSADRPPPPNSMARVADPMAPWDARRAGAIRRAPDADVPAADAADPAATIARGRARYVIYCVPCHDARGAGAGEVVRRGFPAPPPLARIAIDDERWLATIRDGHGRMGGYADRIGAADARAIVAYLHTLRRGAS